jgi:hypothetical protein
MSEPRTDPWRCAGCGRPADLAPRALEVGLVRLATRPEPFALGSAGIEDAVAPVLAPCPACGGRLEAGAGAGEPVDPAFDTDRLRPLAAAGVDRLDASDAAAVGRLRDLWRPRALALAGREGDLTGEEVLRLRLERRLAGLEAEMRRARAAGDEDAAEDAHARYIEVGTTYVRRLVAADARGGSCH